MDPVMLPNLLDPAILFFFLGLLVAGVRSDLHVPEPVVKFLSLYLLVAIGFKGGRALSTGGFGGDLVRVVAVAVLLALVIPAIGFVVLRRRVPLFDAAAIAATYGSVSAVTFVAASNFLEWEGTPFTPAMAVALVLMESPAIVMAVLLASWARARHHGSVPGTVPVPVAVGGGTAAPALSSAAVAGIPIADDHAAPAAARPPAPPGLGSVLREAFTDGAHLLLIGSMIVGALTTEGGAAAMAPFTTGLFKGLLALFLLEMGLVVARELRQLHGVGTFLVGFGLGMPLVGAALAMLLAHASGLNAGDAVLLSVLAASASYIVVPAVVRSAIPEARPSRYFGLALGVTFPFNIVVGIPLYHAVVMRLW